MVLRCMKADYQRLAMKTYCSVATSAQKRCHYTYQVAEMVRYISRTDCWLCLLRLA
jgi:hypothetical protein